MTSVEHARADYLSVWRWLVALLVAGLVVMALPIPKLAAVLLIFAVAAIKAGLVLRNYMHLKYEHALIIAIALVPVILFIGLLVALIPDIALRQ